MPTATPLHREEIKARIRMKFGTLRAFEKARRLPIRSVQDVLRGRAVRKAAQAIAAELCIPLQAVSPHYFAIESTEGDNRQPAAKAHRLNSVNR